MRIARFTTGDDPMFGLVDGAGEKIAEITGDPLYTKIELTGAVHQVDDVRLLAPVIPRSKVIGIGRNYADHVAEVFDHRAYPGGLTYSGHPLASASIVACTPPNATKS